MMVPSHEQHTLTIATLAAFFSQTTQRELLQLWQLPEDDTLPVFAFGKDENIPVCKLRCLVV
jgi:anti-sigma-K factor RskA